MAKQPTQPDPQPPAAQPPPPAEAPQPPPPAEPPAVQLVDIRVTSLVCPTCGRSSVPRVVRTRPEKRQRDLECPFCAAVITVTYRPDGHPVNHVLR